MDMAFEHNYIQDPRTQEIRQIVCGALMGLGTGWTVLTILNSWCAWDAGVKKEAFRTCGDDLIGLFTRTQIAAYESNVERVRLVLNKTKSFVSRHRGVFCERYVRRVNDYEAKAQSLLRIGEAVGAKSTSKGKGILAVDQLRKMKGHRFLLYEARATANRQCVDRNLPGLLSQGGGGSILPANALTVLYYLKYGGNRLQTVELTPTIREQAQKLWKDATHHKGGVPVEEVLTMLKSAEHTSLLLKGEFSVHEPATIKQANLRRQLRSRYSNLTKEVKRHKGPISWLSTMNSTNKLRTELTTKELRDITRLLRIKKFPAAMRRAQGTERYISRDIATATIIHAQSYQPSFNLKLDPTELSWNSTKGPLKEREGLPTTMET
jgi:hypothetical protein